MIEVLSLSQKDVRDRLFARVRSARKPLLVVGLRHGPFMRPPPEREPFASLERDFGDVLDQLVVLDEGSIEGMWRDPLGDLADALYPDDRERAYAAASGYVLLVSGQVRAVVKKRAEPREDRWFLQEALASVSPSVPRPDPARRPGTKGRKAPEPEPSFEPEPEPPREETPRPAARPAGVDPWKLLGIAPGTPLGEAKKAFRTLIAQYHPDKVAHLAPEFRELAETRTRELLAAWEVVERALSK